MEDSEFICNLWTVHPGIISLKVILKFTKNNKIPAGETYHVIGKGGVPADFILLVVANYRGKDSSPFQRQEPVLSEDVSKVM